MKSQAVLAKESGKIKIVVKVVRVAEVLEVVRVIEVLQVVYFTALDSSLSQTLNLEH
ncbi:hypothetical protein [Flexistipes sp.]|uniref:hypothetical protein n=1 Tax=Flexistipes sp. TaxID=3088135 RepID=UPI002E247D97|nr:hypothetical protein [Flexistipes sp.]